MNYTVIKSKRKTVALQIRGSELIVRAPIGMRDRDIASFVKAHEGWIEKHLSAALEREKQNGSVTPMTDVEISELAELARRIIPERVAYYAEMLGVTYGKITLRNQRTRWGSCSSKGNLSFNIALMLAPRKVLDSVIVHELCHRKEMNHSQRFYSEMARVFPKYKECRAWLKENGSGIMRRTERR